MMVVRRMGCWTRHREISIDFDEQERVTMYNGLERCVFTSSSDGTESGLSREGCTVDSLDEDVTSCSSSNNASSSLSSLWTIMKKEDQSQEEWNLHKTPLRSYVKVKPDCEQFSDIQEMKEKFAKLLLGEDITGGTKGVPTALALSNSITGLAASVFGELWKLEPLSEDRRRVWQREMNWFLSPADYMVVLVPTKQNDINGRTLEIMAPKARTDVHVNLPALRKLDSMLIETLDSMVDTEFWYSEIGSRAEGRRDVEEGSDGRWSLPSLRVPNAGLSTRERKKLLHHGKLVFQVFKAAKSINENVLLEMPVPDMIKEALPRSGKASLGNELYKMLTAESTTATEMMANLHLKSEHDALQAINKLEAAILVWKEKITKQFGRKPPVPVSWSLMKDPTAELDRMESLLNQAEALLHQLKTKYPNIPHTFLDATKIQHGKDVAHSILEAYSRVLANLAFGILTRIGDILLEDVASNSNSPLVMSHLVGPRIPGVPDSPMLNRVRDFLIHQTSGTDRKYSDSHEMDTSDAEAQRGETRINSGNVTPSRSGIWCIGKDDA